MRRMVGWITIALVVAPAASGAQAGPGGTATQLALGISVQNGDRSLLALAARLGVTGRILQRLDWGADVTLERLGNADGVNGLCNPDAPCPDAPDAVTLGNLSALLVLREEGGAYLVGGGGVTRLLGDGIASPRTYAHLSTGIGWNFTRDGPGPFLELRFNKYLRARDPMSAWTLPVLLGVRF